MNKSSALLCVVISLSLGLALSAQELSQRTAAFFSSLEHLANEAKIDSLVALTKEYYPGHEDSLYYHLLCGEAIEKTEDVWKAAGLYGKARLQISDRDHAASIRSCEAALPLLEKGNFTVHYLDAINIYGVNHLFLGEHAKATEIYRMAIDYLEQHDLSEKMPLITGMFYYNISVQEYYAENFLGALSNALKSREFKIKSGDTRHIISSSIIIAGLRKEFQDTTAWRVSLREAGDLYLQQRIPLDSLRGIVRLVQAADQLDSAKVIFEEGLSLVQRLREEQPHEILELHAPLLHYMSQLYSEKGQKEGQIELLNQLLSLFPDEYVPKLEVVSARVQLAKHYLETGAIKKALQMAERCRTETIRYGNQEQQSEALNVLAQANARIGKHQTAYSYMRQLLTLQDSIMGRKDPAKMMQIYLTYGFEKEKEILELQQEQAEERAKAQLQQQRILLWGALMALVLLAGIILVLYRNFRNKQRANELLSQQRKELSVVNSRLNRFAGIVSHDLLSNLNLILSRGNVLVGKNGGKEQLRSYYETTQETCRELKQYCEKLLKTARTADTADVLSADETDTIVEKMLNHYGTEFKKLNFSVVRGGLTPLPLPEAVVEQLFHNVITNALKYVPIEGQRPYLYIGSATKAAGDQQTGWIIEDNGPGIPAALMTAIMIGQPQRSRQHSQGVGLSTLVKQLQAYGVALRMENLVEGGLRIVVEKKVAE